MSDRSEFEKHNPVPEGAIWSEEKQGYYYLSNYPNETHLFNDKWEVWQEALDYARAQGGQGAEPVAVIDRSGVIQPMRGAEGLAEGDKLYTHPQPAQQGSVPEWVRNLRKAAEDATPGPWHGGHGASALTACVDWRDNAGNMTSDCFVKTGGHAKVVCKAEPRSWRGALQASKDIAFVSAANPAAVLELISLLSTPATPQPEGNGWKPNSEGPTGWEFRFVEALRNLCGGAEPPDRLVKGWLTHENDELQGWVVSNCTFHWAMGATVIDAAMALADEPEEGAGHGLKRPQPPKEGA